MLEKWINLPIRTSIVSSLHLNVIAEFLYLVYELAHKHLKYSNEYVLSYTNEWNDLTPQPYHWVCLYLLPTQISANSIDPSLDRWKNITNPLQEFEIQGPTTAPTSLTPFGASLLFLHPSSLTLSLIYALKWKENRIDNGLKENRGGLEWRQSEAPKRSQDSYC